MRLLFCVQRYGMEVFGGAEMFARQLATRLAARGHQVEVVTTCAIDYRNWDNAYPPGEEVLDGVLLHRLPVTRSRDPRQFGSIHPRVFSGPGWPATLVQEEWMRIQGPFVAGLPSWMRRHSPDFDAAVFVTYLYWTTWAGLRNCLCPSVLHPTAHDEPPSYVPLFDEMYRLPTAFGFLTPEEEEFVTRRYRVVRPSFISGIGIDPAGPGDSAAFRARFGLGDDPYIAYVGRTDPGKGSPELLEYFRLFKERHPGPLKLVFVGEVVYPMPAHPDVVYTGFVDEATRTAGIAGAALLAQPSYFESFSLVLAEAWAQGVPALVQGQSPVLLGQARRSGGALPYTGFAEFEAGLEFLMADPDLRRRMGVAGRDYVLTHYPWDRILERYEAFLAAISSTKSRSLSATAT